MSTAELERRVDADATGAVRALGLVVADVAVTPAGKRRVVRVSLDRDLDVLDLGDGTSAVPTVSLDEVAEATKAVSAALDASDALGSTPYVLEVSSPGVGRALTAPSHFRRNVTRLLELTLIDGTVLLGRLVQARAEGVTIVVGPAGKTPRTEHRMAYSDILRAQVQVEFGRHDDPEHGDPEHDDPEQGDAANVDVALDQTQED